MCVFSVLQPGRTFSFRFGLVAKFPHSRRWRTTRLGRRLMATAIQIREINFPQLLALAA